MNTIQQEWVIFSDLCSLNELSDDEQKNMKRAFYCGCMAVFKIEDSITNGKISHQAALAIIDNLQDECVQFSRDLQSGKA